MLIGGLVGAIAGVYIISSTHPILGITMGEVSLEDILIPILTTSVGFFGGLFIGRVVGCDDK